MVKEKYIILGILAISAVILLSFNFPTIGKFTFDVNTNQDYLVLELGPNFGDDERASFIIRDSSSHSLKLINTLSEGVLVLIPLNGNIERVVTKDGTELSTDVINVVRTGNLVKNSDWTILRSVNYYGRPSDYILYLNGKEYHHSEYGNEKEVLIAIE